MVTGMDETVFHNDSDQEGNRGTEVMCEDIATC